MRNSVSQIRRKGLRKDGVAFDDAGIAVGGPLARLGAIDQRNRKPALDEMQRDRGADDAGPQHDDIGARHGKTSAAATRYLRRSGAVSSRSGDRVRNSVLTLGDALRRAGVEQLRLHLNQAFEQIAAGHVGAAGRRMVGVRTGLLPLAAAVVMLPSSHPHR